MNAELVLYQNVKGTDVLVGDVPPRHVKVSVGFYSDTDMSFEIFVVRPMSHKTRHAEALAFTLTHVQDLGLKPSRVRGVFVARAKKPRDVKTDIDGQSQRKLF